MNVTKISENNNVLRLLVKDVDVSFMNAVRRAALNAVQVLAVDSVRIYENNSVAFDEYLAQRLALVPIQTDRKAFKKDDTIQFVLNKQGPCTVYSRDLTSADPSTQVANNNILLAKLNEGQSIKLEAVVTLGSGKQHSKFQPGIVAYAQLPKIKSRKEIKKPEKIVQSHASGLLEVKYNKVIAKNPYDWSASDYEEIAKDPQLDVEFEENSFVVHVETNGALNNTEILLAACDVLTEKLDEFRKELGKE